MNPSEPSAAVTIAVTVISGSAAYTFRLSAWRAKPAVQNADTLWNTPFQIASPTGRPMRWNP